MKNLLRNILMRNMSQKEGFNTKYKPKEYTDMSSLTPHHPRAILK